MSKTKAQVKASVFMDRPLHREATKKAEASGLSLSQLTAQALREALSRGNRASAKPR